MSSLDLCQVVQFTRSILLAIIDVEEVAGGSSTLELVSMSSLCDLLLEVLNYSEQH